jgi:transcription-repair coupling factor (superfamily II helicase)
MAEHELEHTMDDFNERKFDILVCTMIVESGLDMPNVNTIIVDDAHQFGLADLYQLRGRVGRSSRQAYCYLIIPTDLVVDGAARHRLKAILENTALGSGYAIAMKDLEIRGAGNLLGAQQSGHIAAIGFTLYCTLLQRAVDFLKKGKAAEIPAPRDDAASGHAGKADWRKDLPHWQPARDVELRLPFSGNIPEEYVASAALRLDLFRRIGQAHHASLLHTLEKELRDRFGPLPDETLLLLRQAETRIHARARGIDCIEHLDGKIVLRRQGRIMNTTTHFPRITGLRPVQAVDVVLASLTHLAPLHG